VEVELRVDVLEADDVVVLQHSAAGEQTVMRSG
jgi:hypothetical protein